MGKTLRIVIGICFLLGAVVFAYRGNYAYTPIALLIGGLYLYKGWQD